VVSRQWRRAGVEGPCRLEHEKLKGNLAGKYSIRINDQFRIVFNFERGEATNVAITDYHR
jgi:plasmid maintenance system killer protein